MAGEQREGHARSELDRLIPQVYDDLLRIARRQLNRELGPPSLQASTLVHEAYLKLAGNPPSPADLDHLLAIAAHAMRQVLVDRARSRGAEKRGGAWARTTLTDPAGPITLDDLGLLALNDAIDRLDPRQRHIVECRFFGGMSEAEIAAALGITERTVQRDWAKARAWLGRWLHEAPAT